MSKGFLKWIAMAFFVASFGIAAPGDLKYEVGGHRVQITAQQASCFAQCVVAIDNATGDSLCGGISASKMKRVKVEKDSSVSPVEYFAVCKGELSAPHDALPIGPNGVRVIGRE